MQRGLILGLVSILSVVFSLTAQGSEDSAMDYGKYIYGNQDQSLKIKSGPLTKGTAVVKSGDWKTNEQIQKPLLADVTRSYSPNGDPSKGVTQYVQVFESQGGNPGEIVQYRKLGGKKPVEEFSHLMVGKDWKISAATKCRSADSKICASVNSTVCNDLKNKAGVTTMDQLTDVANKCGAVNSAVEGFLKSKAKEIAVDVDVEIGQANDRFEQLVNQKNIGSTSYALKSALGKDGFVAAHKSATVEQQDLMLRACAETFSDSAVAANSSTGSGNANSIKAGGARK